MKARALAVGRQVRRRRGTAASPNGSIAAMSRARVIPAVDFLLGQAAVEALATRHGARAVRSALEHEVRELRAAETQKLNLVRM